MPLNAMLRELHAALVDRAEDLRPVDRVAFTGGALAFVDARASAREAEAVGDPA